MLKFTVNLNGISSRNITIYHINTYENHGIRFFINVLINKAETIIKDAVRLISIKLTLITVQIIYNIISCCKHMTGIQTDSDPLRM